MSRVVVYSTQVCPYCQMAVRLLQSYGVIHVEKVLIDLDPKRRIEMIERTGQRTVPQIFIGSTHIGGYADLAELDRIGKLTLLLEVTCTSFRLDTPC
ncbi:glutaredoxin 3 [Candidatus Vallotiella sp. (ex Adelges kitamiensis)]|uniref:glutaredoxin 3 n=1 Tax=Candidatus Vallotiella sp. (ex Adelges kitamiensis) TaxID=2864217 RepID=UPI001CE3345D|nr:glutaredoxin 3 [Candidatus Vallotia sp. (ex Adelges kitamiensis)]